MGTIERMSLHVVVFRGQRHWVAQCLEVDIAAQAERLEDLPDRFARALLADMRLCREREQEPFSGLPQAPARYWAMWKGSEPVNETAPWEQLPGFLVEPHIATARVLA